MLIRLMKIAAWIAYKLFRWFALPIGKLIYRLTWRGTLQQFVLAVIDDPELVRVAADAGVLNVIEIYRQKLLSMTSGPRLPTQEDIDWANFVMHYGENPQPDMVPAYLAYLNRTGIEERNELPAWGALTALCARHRDLYREWTRAYPDLFSDLEQRSERAGEKRAGWNDYHMSRWFILRSDEESRIIAERTKLPGMVGGTCRWMANSVAQQLPAFREALERAGYDFQAPDMQEAVLADIGQPEAEAHYPLSTAAVNDFFQNLQGATIKRATAALAEDEEDGRELEHIEVETSAGVFCVSAPDLNVSFQTEAPSC